MSDFEQMAPAALRLAGFQPDDSDLAVLAVVAQVFGPAMTALDAADLAQLPPEPALDPSRAPRRAAEQ